MLRRLPALLLFCSSALAAGSTTVTPPTTAASSPVVINATAVNACTLSTTDASFGAYAATASIGPIANATLAVQCNTGASYTLFLGSASSATNGGVPFMTKASGSAADVLEYNLDSVTPSDALDGFTVFTATGTTDAFTLSYRITPNQYSVTSGAYTDTQTVEITLLN